MKKHSVNKWTDGKGGDITFKLKHGYMYMGYALNRVAFSIVLSRHEVSIDFLFFFIQWELR